MRDVKWFRALRKRDFENGAVLDEIEEVFLEVDRLTDILDKLPKTADGVWPVGQMSVWFLYCNCIRSGFLDTWDDRHARIWEDESNNPRYPLWPDVYSTHEAAEAARKERER